MKKRTSKFLLSFFGVALLTASVAVGATACSNQTTSSSNQPNKNPSSKPQIPSGSTGGSSISSSSGNTNHSGSPSGSSDKTDNSASGASSSTHSDSSSSSVNHSSSQGSSSSSPSQVQPKPVVKPQASSGSSSGSVQTHSASSSPSSTTSKPDSGTTTAPHPSISPKPSVPTSSSVPVSHPTTPSKPVVLPTPTLSWSNNAGTTFVDLAKTNELSIPLNVANWTENPSVTYSVSSPTLNVSNLNIETNNNNAFVINDELKQMLAANSYTPLTITASATNNNKTITSQPLNVVIYNSDSVPVNKGQTALYWIPTNYNQKDQCFNAPTSFDLLTPYNLQSGQHFELQRTTTEFWDSNTTYTQALNLNSDNKTIDVDLVRGFQNIRLCVVNSDGQVAAVSNTLSINATQQNYVHLTANNVVNQMVQIGTNQSCSINVSTNDPKFSLSDANIYYQNINTNEAWVSLKQVKPSFFSYSISGNTLNINNFYVNTATNIKIVDPNTNTASDVLTLSSYVPNGSYQTNVYVNDQLLDINNNHSYTANTNSINLSFVPNLNAKLYQYSDYVFENKQWTPLQLTNNGCSFSPKQKGTYQFKVVSNWKNNCVSPVVTNYFNINFKPDVTSQTIQTDNTNLQKWISEPNNMVSVYKDFLQNNPSWLLTYLYNWCYGYRLNITAQNIGQIFNDWQIHVGSNHQVYLSANVVGKLNVQEWHSNDTLNFTKGNTFYVGLPLYTTSNSVETIKASVNAIGYSQLEIALNFNHMKKPLAQGLSWVVYDNNTHKPATGGAKKAMSPIQFNMSVISNSFWTNFTLSHYSAQNLPQYVNNLNPLSNKPNQQ